MFIDSLVIEDRTENRLLFLYIKFFLELCGYEVLEERQCKLISSEECRFRRIIFVSAPIEDIGDAICLQVTKMSREQVRDSLCAELTSLPEEQESLLRIAKGYDFPFFQDLYTVTYLYASRFVDYSGEKMLLDVSKSLSLQSNTMEKALLLGGYSWRDIYAYLYTVNKTNEGLYKLHAYSYRSYDTLRQWIEKLKETKGFDRSAFLLEADIICNTAVNIRDSIGAYARLQDSPFYCTRFWTLYALGECLLKSADVRYRNIYEDDDCHIRVELNEAAIEVFTREWEMKEDEIRIIYKIALQDERRGLSDKVFLKPAREKFQKIVDYIDMIPEGQRTTLEFEYLYKTYMRIGYINKLEGSYMESQQAYEKAKETWEELSEKYLLFNDIFGEKADNAREVLNIRHRSRNRAIDLCKSELAMLKKI